MQRCWVVQALLPALVLGQLSGVASSQALQTHVSVPPPADRAVPRDLWPEAPPGPRVAPRKGAPQPHIILHVTDDQGWGDPCTADASTGAEMFAG